MNLSNFRLVMVALAAVLVCTPSCALLAPKPAPKRIAAIVTEYRHNSHADVIVSRILESYTLDGKGEYPNLKLASLYTDQPSQTNPISASTTKT